MDDPVLDHPLDDPRTAEDPEAVKRELIAEIKIAQAQKKRAVALTRELRTRARRLLGYLEDMENAGLIEWPEELPRRDLTE